MDISDPNDIIESIISFCRIIDLSITREEFDKYDKDSNGYLSLKELNTPAKSILTDFQKELSKRKKVVSIKKLYEKFDLNKDGKISFDEFKNMMECIFAKLVVEELKTRQKDPDCPEDMKDLDLLKFLNDRLSTIPEEDQVHVQKFIENAKKDY